MLNEHFWFDEWGTGKNASQPDIWLYILYFAVDENRYKKYSHTALMCV